MSLNHCCVRRLPSCKSCPFGGRIALAGRVELLRPIVALADPSGAVDPSRWVAESERFRVVAEMKRLEVEHIANVLRQSRIRPDERHVTCENDLNR